MSKHSEVSDWFRNLIDGSAKVVRPSSLSARLRSSRNKKTKRFLRKHVWDATDNIFDLNKIMETTSDKIFLGVSDVEDLITAEILKARSEAGLSTVFRETSVLCNREKWQHWAELAFPNEQYLFVQSSSSSGFIVEKTTNNLIKFSVNSNTTEVRAFGDEDFADDNIEIVESTFDQVTCHIEWVYGSNGESVNVPLNRDRLPVDEMYPFLKGESLNDYYDRYMASSANILLLIGPPGTGKTTFIRGLLAHTNSSAIVSYDAGILDKDGFFARFIESDDNVMVLEDSDAFLKPRSDGNTMMHRFLNVGDGLVTTKGKKMIFSTNLPSIRDIDSALTRPGRCFDIIEFGNMSYDEAKLLADKLKAPMPDIKDQYSVAEIFNSQTQMLKPKERKVGFI
jgi:SpoVK/Ycf46/Vps4 family AAA+-type ATPase